jgi:3-hydroxymyristoyl/3-hydroxydecanoyl-(acyl carrier protein) dehydratase
MLDEIISVEYDGGNYGQGKLTASKNMNADFWAFDVHFKNDPVFPGSLLSEAANQIQVIFAISAGYIQEDKNYYLTCLKEMPIKASFRGQVRPVESLIRFEQHFKLIEESDGKVVLISDCDVFWQDIHVVRTEDISLVIEEVVL